MDFSMAKDLVLLLLAGFGTVLWFLYQELKSKMDGNTKDMSDFKVHVAEKYVNHNDLADVMAGVKDVMRSMKEQLNEIQKDFKDFAIRISDKLETKVDKQ